MLEIGYTSGGHSLAAFERLGFEVSGVDNYYDGVVRRSRCSLASSCTIRPDADVELLVGDIADRRHPGRTRVRSRSSPRAWSSTCATRWARFGSAAACSRQVGPALHIYEPYYSLRGRPRPGTLDAPFGHARVDRRDHARYIAELRPLEAPVAVPVGRRRPEPAPPVPDPLCRRRGGAPGQVLASRREDRPPELTDALMAECLELNPDIRPHDLLADQVFFGCQPGPPR